MTDTSKAVVAAPDAAEQRRQEHEFSEILEKLGGELEEKKDGCVAHKTPIETRMLLDEAQYWGVTYGGNTKADTAAGLGDRAVLRGGTPVDNKTRSKTRVASARIGDMLFPTNSPNWSLKPSPEPEIADEVLQKEYKAQLAKIPPVPEGQPQPELPPIDLEALSWTVAQRRCRKMVRKIKDTFVESHYPKIGRKCIFDGCKVGTGIVKGPYVRNRIQKKYKSQQAEGGAQVELLTSAVVKKPAVARVSPWMFFPQRARSIEECEFAFELHLYNKTQLQQMVMTHGFNPERTAKIIELGPKRGSVDTVLTQRAAITGEQGEYEQCWAVWEYHGPIDAKVLKAAGVELQGTDEQLKSYYGEIWFAEGIITRISLSPLEADSSLPYHVWCYEEDETSIFGFGIPFVMRDDQYVIDMMWDAMIHNAAVSAGPQVAIIKGVVTPADNSYNIRGPKLWYINDEDMKIGDAIQTMVVPSTINNNMPLYQQAKQNADENTNLPMLVGGGDAKDVKQTLDGRSEVMNQQNIVQRAAAHSWDDNITIRLLPRFYDWFMQHDPDPSIKGDYEVEARGASYLLVKETQAQHAQLLIQMAAQDPEIKILLNMEELYRVYLGFLDIPTDALIKSPEQVERDRANIPPDEMAAANLQKVQAETDLLVAKAETERGGTGTPEEDGQPSPDKMVEMQMLFLKLSDKESDRATQLEVERMRMHTAMMRVASDENIAYDTLMADMERFTRKQSSDDFFKAAQLRLDEFRETLKSINLGKGFDTFG